MIGFSNTTSIFELSKIKKIPICDGTESFNPSNNISVNNLAPILNQSQEISVKRWGIDDGTGEIKKTININDVLANKPMFEPCIIPINGYFLLSEFNAIYKHSKAEKIIYIAGVIQNDSFLFVTSNQYQLRIGYTELPIVLDDETEKAWILGEWMEEMESREISDRLVSKLSLGSDSYNGNRRTEEYRPFDLQTKTLNMAKEMIKEEFPTDPNWFDN